MAMICGKHMHTATQTPTTTKVYNGSKANWKETDACQPVNAYGQTKLEAEQVIQQQWPHHVILRSSIIYGPQSPSPVSRALFLQFIESSLAYVWCIVSCVVYRVMRCIVPCCISSYDVLLCDILSCDISCHVV